MDSEKHHQVQTLISEGRSPNDEGPFYHHTFWESYKGSVKGKLGGLVIGSIAGATVGTALFVLGSIAGMALSPLAVIGGMAAAGMVYAQNEFSEVGRVTGAVAAAQHDAEDRMQEFEKSRFNDIKHDISELKSMIGGNPAEATVPVSSSASNAVESCDKVEQKLDNYRTTHHDPSIPKPKGNGLIFWKVAAVGLAVGAGVGLLLSAVGAMAGVAIGGFLPSGLGALVATPTAAAVTGGAIGASFGVNRDAFRRVFDKTDLLFKGMFNFSEAKHSEPQPSLSASKERPIVNTLIYPDSGVDYPTSDTFHRDQLAARANQLLTSMDHTTASRH